MRFHRNPRQVRWPNSNEELYPGRGVNVSLASTNAHQLPCPEWTGNAGPSYKVRCSAARNVMKIEVSSPPWNRPPKRIGPLSFLKRGFNLRRSELPTNSQRCDAPVSFLGINLAGSFRCCALVADEGHTFMSLVLNASRGVSSF